MLWKLTKIRLLGLLNRNVAKQKKANGKGTAILLAILFLFCIGVFGMLFFGMFLLMAESMQPLPQYQWFFFALVGLVSFGISFFFTAFTAKSELFEAKDNELLFSMPLRPRTILLSRMLMLLGAEYLFSLLVMIPAGLAWFLTAGSAGVQLVYYILGGLFLPLLSVSFASLIGWLLARLTAKARNKTLVTMILSLGFLAIYFVVYFRAQTYIQLLLQNLESSADSVAVWGFLFKWLGDGIAYGEIWKLLSVIVISLAAFAVAVALISRGFMKTTFAKPAAEKAPKAALELRSSKVSSALLRREIKRFLSSSVYMLNCGLGLIMSVAAAVILLFKAADVRAVLPKAAMIFSTDTELALAVAVVLSFLASMDILTAPSVSLEGKTLWIVRSSPVSAREILMAKLEMHELFCAPPAIVLSVAAAIVLQTNGIGWILLLLIPQLFVLLSGALGLMMNLLFPKLDWTNETVPVKQGAAVILTMLAMMVLITVSVVGTLLLVLNGVLSALTFLLIVIGFSAVLCALCLLWLRFRGTKRFEAL